MDKSSFIERLRCTSDPKKSSQRWLYTESLTQFQDEFGKENKTKAEAVVTTKRLLRNQFHSQQNWKINSIYNST